MHLGPLSVDDAHFCDCSSCRACVAANELRPAMDYRNPPVLAGIPAPVAVTGRLDRIKKVFRTIFF